MPLGVALAATTFPEGIAAGPSIFTYSGNGLPSEAVRADGGD